MKNLAGFRRLILFVILLAPSLAFAQTETVNNPWGYLNSPGPINGSIGFGSQGQSGSCGLSSKTSNLTLQGVPSHINPYQSFRVSFQLSYSTPGSFFSSFTIGCTGITFVGNISGTYIKPVTVQPLYKILSILSDPPGNASSNGYNNATSAGTTTSTSNNFSTSDTLTFSYGGGILGVFNKGGSVSFTTGKTTGDTHSFETDYSTSTGYQLGSVQQNIDHTQDQFFLWLNPEVTYYQNGSSSAYYTLENAGGGSNMDIVNVNAAQLANPTLIPLTALETQNPAPGVYLPGLKAICANPVPDNQCTQANACGCVPNDFATILAEDPLIGVSQTTAPTTVDSNRFVYVDYVTLQGPAQQGGGPVTETFTQTDSNLSSYTNSVTHSHGVGFTGNNNWNFAINGTGFTLSVSNTNTFEWSETQSYGTSNGTAHTASVTMGSSKVGCYEYVDVYEDTVFHTYTFALPSNPPAACQ
jgi:hypothetical protein